MKFVDDDDDDDDDGDQTNVLSFYVCLSKFFLFILCVFQLRVILFLRVQLSMLCTSSQR